MADQIFNVYAGFFDAQNKDRTYYADDMNRPYRRIVGNGVFATPLGTPSTDLQVMATDSMQVNVMPGDGIFAYKWFANQTVLSITVPANNAIAPRIDSVIAQMNTLLEGRVGSIVYRTGTAASEPVPPAINTVEGIVEYRIANILVEPSASVISQSKITDLRGTSECPWVTGLIQQVDTSTLFLQWQSAFQKYFEDSTSSFTAFENERQADWDEFFARLTEDLTISTSIARLTSSFITTGQTTSVPLNIQSYNPAQDILTVYINGLLADSTKYSYVSGNNSINLVNSLEAEQRVDFVVLKSVMTGDVSSFAAIIQRLEDAIAAASSDSGWAAFTLTNGTAYTTQMVPAIRTIGKNAYIRGAIKGITSVGTIATLATTPNMAHVFTTTANNGSSVTATLTMQLNTDGTLSLIAVSGNLSENDMISLATTFSLD